MQGINVHADGTCIFDMTIKDNMIARHSSYCPSNTRSVQYRRLEQKVEVNLEL